MEVSSAIASAVSLGAAQGLAFSKLLLPRHSAVLAVAASGALPVDSIAPPTIRSDPCCRTAPRALTRRTRRTRRRSLTDSDGEDGFSGDGDGDDGPFGGGGGGEGSGGGGRGWNSDRFGDADWEDAGGGSRPPSSLDLAFDVVYEVLSWVALSNCAHFAYKKMGQFLTNREKAVPMRLMLAIC